MPPSGKHKSEAELEPSGLAAWLRGLADAVDAGELLVQGERVPLEGFREIKVSLRADPALGCRARLSVKFPKSPGAMQDQPETDASDEALSGEVLPKYKSLKKHMKYTFRAIGQALAAGTMPPEAEARSFLADSRLMVSYPGKGDAFYAAYLEKTLAFEAALEARDLAALQALHAELAQLKRDCHSRWA